MPNSITVVVGKARPVGDQDIPDANIAIIGETPKLETLEGQDLFFDHQAVMIESLLHRSLPGGLYDRLAAQMLQRAASHLAVSHVRPATRSEASAAPVNGAATDLLRACETGDSMGNTGPALLFYAADLVNWFAPSTANELRRKADAEQAAILKARGEKEVQHA